MSSENDGSLIKSKLLTLPKVMDREGAAGGREGRGGDDDEDNDGEELLEELILNDLN
jgi:hypothetical protein